jgi:signal peptidase
VKTLLGRVLSVVLWSGVVLTAALLGAVVVVPKVMGWVPLTVLSGSMTPTYPVGSQVVVERVQGNAAVERLHVGDVVTFLPEPDSGRLVTHRIVERVVRQDGTVEVRTRGDANDAVDPWRLTATQIRGRVRYGVPLVGYAAHALGQAQKDIGLKLVAGGLFAVAAWQLGGLARGLRRRPVVHATGRGGRPD